MRNEGKSICNCCGRVLEQEEYINIEKQWGYFSDRDGTIQRGKICEECFERIAKTFKIPLGRGAANRTPLEKEKLG